MGFRFLPYKKAKKGVQIAGVDYDDSGGGISTLANKTDLTAIILTGTTNTSGSTITSGTWFYLNGVLVKAKADIANGATFTENTNYEAKTVGDELTELNSKIRTKNISGNTDSDGMINVGIGRQDGVLLGYRPTQGDIGGYGFNYYFSCSGDSQYITFTNDNSVSTPFAGVGVAGVLYYMTI